MSAVVPEGEVGFVIADDTAIHTTGAGYVTISGPEGTVHVHRSDLPQVRAALDFFDRSTGSRAQPAKDPDRRPVHLVDDMVSTAGTVCGMAPSHVRTTNLLELTTCKTCLKITTQGHR